MKRVSTISDTVISQLGLDLSSLEWQKLSLCSGVPPRLFYEDYEKDAENAKQVDALCLSCPVMKQCAEAGADGEHGVWGAIFWDGSGKPDKSKNKHKTELVWQEIRTKISD